MSTDRRRIKLVVAYDGTDYRGWAAQAGQRTVQGTLTEAVRRATGEDLEIVGASRTDSGAHALGQTCHFDTAVPIPGEKWPSVLNRLLPLDLRIREAELVDESFHSRFCAEYRYYQYRIVQTDQDPFRARFAHIYDRPLDANAMQAGLNRLIGSHDFRAFSEELPEGTENTTRTLLKGTVESEEDEVAIDIDGTAFMRGMMRRIAGFLLEVGRGHRPASDAEGLLSKDKDRFQWPVVLPARGLCLMEVAYANPPVDHRKLENSFEDFCEPADKPEQRKRRQNAVAGKTAPAD